MGTFECCTTQLPVITQYAIGSAPCGQPIVRVPHDDGVEAAYRTGGPCAVLALLAARIGPPELVEVYDDALRAAVIAP